MRFKFPRFKWPRLRWPSWSIDKWDALTLAGTALLGAGVWMRWGAPWAFILLGSFALGLAALHALILALVDAIAAARNRRQVGNR
jgi:hypothetical protein